MGYVRSGSKDHGRRNQIEGKLTPGERVVVIEDLISTGGSVLDTVAALRAAGAEVLGVISIFTYGMAKGRQRLAEAGVKWPGCWPSGTTPPTKTGSEKENEPYEPSH